METLDPQHFERIDGHLASCPECTIEMERLVEASEVWRGKEGGQRLAALWARTRQAMGMQEFADFLQLDFAVESLAQDPQLMVEEDEEGKEMSEALQAYLQGEFDAPMSPRVSELLARLRGHLRLTAEDRLLLRLRFQDGLTVQAIARRLHLEGDPHKRMNKLISRLRKACLKAFNFGEEKPSTGQAAGSDVNAPRNITERESLALAFREPDLTLRQALLRGYITGRAYQALRRGIKKYLERDLPFLCADLIRKGAVLSPDERIVRGQKLLDDLKPALRESLCEAWQLCEKVRDEADMDPVELIATIAHVISPVVHNVPATLIATILVKLGVRNFCNCHGHESGSGQPENGKAVR